MARPKTFKARDADLDKITELSRREREEIEKQRAHERYMKLQKQGKTDQAKKDLEWLALIDNRGFLACLPKTKRRRKHEKCVYMELTMKKSFHFFHFVITYRGYKSQWLETRSNAFEPTYLYTREKGVYECVREEMREEMETKAAELEVKHQQDEMDTNATKMYYFVVSRCFVFDLWI